MKSTCFWTAATLAVLTAPTSLYAQQFFVGDVPVQIHGFVSQGFAKTNENNFLTMKTVDGSGSLTDAGLNASAQVTKKFRVGAQLYVRNVGDLGNGRFELDWGFADYRFKQWLGVRGGKVKTALGLYNDVQDIDFLHTWALLPQSMYPVDLRGSTIAHVGGDVYGIVPLKSAGQLAYTLYGGRRPEDPEGGYAYGLNTFNNYRTYAGNQEGADLRWSTPVSGLLVGASYLNQQIVGEGTRVATGAFHREESKKDETTHVYGQYMRNGFRLDMEARRYVRDQWLVVQRRMIASDTRSFYASAAQRLNKRVEVGGYYSWLVYNWPLNHGADDNHIFDKVATVRVDLSERFLVKVEGHFMDGYGAHDAIRGFYVQNNTAGLQPQTSMLVIRTGVNF